MTDQNYSISIGGLLTLRDLNNMSITVDPITFSNNGISFSSITTSADQTFKIFGADFTLKNVGRYNAITASYVNNILYLTLCGEIEFLGKKLNFTNLKVGTNGSISLAEGSAFVDGTMQLIPDYLTLKRFELAGSPVKLRLTGEAKLPAPASNFMKEFSFSMRSNGEVEGSAVINILDTEASRLDNSPAVDASEYDLNFAVFDPTHLSLNLDFANLRNSALRLVADLYLTKTISGSQTKKIAFGASNPFAAGFELKFDGTRRWNVNGSYQLNDIKWEILKLNNVAIGVEGNGNNFALLLSGKLLLDLPGIGGTGLDFAGLRFTSEGNIENLTSSIRGGRFELLQTASLDVSKIEYSNTPTNLDLRGGSSPSAASPHGNTTAPASINVQSYFRFGGQFSIDGVASGGVEDFLYYKTIAGRKGLVIKNANLSVQELLTFNADFQYQDLGANKYNFLVGGSGKLLNEYEMAVVGKLARTNKGVSFGLFVAGDIPPITIPPCILLTGLGGGFFLNPEQSDLNLVKQLAALGDAPKAIFLVCEPEMVFVR